MHKAIAHYPPTNIQPVPDQQLLLPANCPSFIVVHDTIWYRIFLWPVWVSCPGSVPYQLFVPPPDPLLAGQGKKLKHLWFCAALLSNN